ncbi:MAG: ADP-ribosylglycohydrolase family protein [Lachnospiraceae bacterium]
MAVGGSPHADEPVFWRIIRSEEAQQMIYQYTGTGLQSTESIPAAAALFCSQRGSRRCAEFTANIGGDTDTMGAMACGICGALTGADVFPEEAQQLHRQCE